MADRKDRKNHAGKHKMPARCWIPVAVVTVFVLGFLYYRQRIPKEYMPKDDEIAFHIKLDLKEDIGLLVYDYQVGEHEYSGGTSNADQSLMQRDSDNLVVWNRQELDSSADPVTFSIRFRIITEYVEPNYENVYPENITKCMNPVSVDAHYGKSYFVTITGSKEHGYTAALERV